MRRPRNPRAKALIYTGAAVLGIGAFAWFNGDPHPSRASGPADSYVLYGIRTDNGKLHRYDLDRGSLSTVGTIKENGAAAMHGIQAAAYFPGFTNIYGFWYDSAAEASQLVYINTATANATVVGPGMGEEKITGAVGVQPPGTNDYEVYALQEADTLPFDIINGTVVPNIPLSARVTVLGAAITYGGQYDMPVTMQIKTASTVHESFGDYAAPAHDPVNDDQNPRSSVLPGVYSVGTPISVIAKSWELHSSGNSGTQNNHWDPYLEADSSQNSPQVIILRTGDPVPNIPAFMDQASVEEFLFEYINHDTKTMDLGPNQAVYLFELGTTNLSSSAADFQDLVVLLTFAEEDEELESTTTSYTSISGSINVNPNNSPKNRFVLAKTDNTVTDRDDLHENAPIDGFGVLYSGPANSLRIKPKGNGVQNTLMIDGVIYEINNGTTYLFDAPGMVVTVRNDHPSNGQAMGHWWIDLTSGPFDVTDGDGTDDPAANSQIILVDQ